MTVYAVAESVPELSAKAFTAGRRYEVLHEPRPGEGTFAIVGDDGAEWWCFWGGWTRIDEPTPSQTVSQDRAVEAVARAMREAVIRDDEGEFPRLFDLLDFSGENKAHTVVNGLAKAAVEALVAFKKSEVGHEA